MSDAQKTKKKPAAKQPAPKASAPWSASFVKRLPHKVGEPLSSGGGGADSSVH